MYCTQLNPGTAPQNGSGTGWPLASSGQDGIGWDGYYVRLLDCLACLCE